ncbi:MAG: MarR family transcriptional regulator [Planctomycetes bacterium]|nr:MarR family transcriptional regulator [Planctomycetota bacterium]
MSRLQQEIKQTKPFTSLAEETFLNLQRTADRLLAEEAEVLARHDLTPPQYNVLRILRGAGANGHPCQEIAARMISRVPDITRLVDRLEQAGLATRARDQQDRRVVTVRIAPRGEQLLASIDPTMRELPKRLFGALTTRDLQTLNDLLVRARADR